MSRSSSFVIDSYGNSHIGKVRKTNQDQFLIASLSKQLSVVQSSIPPDFVSSVGNMNGQLFVVADGIGGGVAGEWASALAIQSFTTYVLKLMHWHLREAETREDIILSEFQEVLGYCESQLQTYEERHPDFRGMGTTLTAAYLVWPHLFVIHAGDSRCYVLHDNCLFQITADHTVAEDMIPLGLFTPQMAARSEMRHCLSNSIGASRDAVQSQFSFIELHADDTILLCSDGLTNHVSDERLLSVMTSDQSAKEICEQLIQDSLDKGGQDNITAVVSRVRSTTAADSGIDTSRAGERKDDHAIVNHISSKMTG
jgi:protein phosphatase